MYLPTRRWVAGARSAANPCAASPFCDSLVLASQNLSSLHPRPQQKQSARVSGRAVDSRARREQEVRSSLHAASGVRRVFVGCGLESYRLQSVVRVDSQASACLFTNRLASSARVRGRSSHHHTGFAGIPLRRLGPHLQPTRRPNEAILSSFMPLLHAATAR